MPIVPLDRLSRSDLVCCIFILTAGISELRVTPPGGSGLDAIRAELRRREFAR